MFDLPHWNWTNIIISTSETSGCLIERKTSKVKSVLRRESFTKNTTSKHANRFSAIFKHHSSLQKSQYNCALAILPRLIAWAFYSSSAECQDARGTYTQWFLKISKCENFLETGAATLPMRLDASTLGQGLLRLIAVVVNLFPSPGCWFADGVYCALLIPRH